MAASFSPSAFADLFWLEVRIAARTAGRWHDWHFVASRGRRDMHLRINIARRMDDAPRPVEPLTEILISHMRLRIKLTRGIVIGSIAPARLGRRYDYGTRCREA